MRWPPGLLAILCAACGSAAPPVEAMRAEAAAALAAQVAARKCLGEDAFEAGSTRAHAEG